MGFSTTWYFVRDGKMHSGWVLACIEVNVISHNDDDRSLYMLLLGDMMHSVGQRVDQIEVMIERPGQWCLMSGDKIVHRDDLFATRESAAEAYKQKLISEL